MFVAEVTTHDVAEADTASLRVVFAMDAPTAIWIESSGGLVLVMLPSYKPSIRTFGPTVYALPVDLARVISKEADILPVTVWIAVWPAWASAAIAVAQSVTTVPIVFVRFVVAIGYLAIDTS